MCTEGSVYLLPIRIEKLTPQPAFIAGQTHSRALSIFSSLLLHQQYQERTDDTSVVNMKFLLEYRLVRNGGVLFEFVKHLQRYIKTSINPEKLEKILLGVRKNNLN